MRQEPVVVPDKDPEIATRIAQLGGYTRTMRARQLSGIEADRDVLLAFVEQTRSKAKLFR